MRISTLKVVYILFSLIISTAFQASAQVRVQGAVISDSRSNYITVSFNSNITVSNADGFRLTGGAARIKSLVGGSGSSQLTFSLTDHALPDDEFKLLYWPELGDARNSSGNLQAFESLNVSNQVSSYRGNGDIYYISTSGSDNNNGTSSSSPFRSPDKALSKVGPGDYILLKRGDYWDRTNIILEKSGTASRYITLGAYGKGNKPIVHSKGVSTNYKGYSVKGATISIRGDYVLVDNIYVKTDISIGGSGTDDGIQILGCKYSIVSNCIAEGTKHSGGHFGIRVNTLVHINGKETALFNTTHPEVLNCEVFGGYRSLIGTQIWPYDGKHSILQGGLIENCIARDIDTNSRNAWENIMINRGNMNGFVIRKNHVFHHFASGIETFGAKNVIIEYNKIHDPVSYSVHGRGIKGGGYNNAGQTAPGIGELVSSNIIIRYNEIYNIHHSRESNENGIDTGNSSSGKIYGNLIYNVGENGIKLTGTLDSKGWDVYNNTVLDAGHDGLQIYSLGTYATRVSVSNNILQGKVSDMHANISSGSINGKHNIFINGKSRGKYNGDGDRNTSTSNLFQNPGKHNYALKENAPAVDQGVRLTEYKKDIVGTKVANLPDIGAFEFAVNQPDNGPSPEPEPEPEPENPSADAGLNYKYYEGNWSSLPNFNNLNAVKTGTVSNFSLAPRKREEMFAFVFEGSIQIDSDGDYTFYTSSDDGSQLFINNQRIVNNDGLHGAQERSGKIRLSKGRHPIRVAFFERTSGQVLEVRYSGPGVSKKPIPASKLFRDGSSSSPEPEPEPTPEPEPEPENPSADAGLNYRYFEGRWPSLPNFNNLNAVKTGTVSNFSLSPRRQDNNFAFVFEGFIQIDSDGEYTFYTSSDDGSQLFINNQRIVDNDGLHGAQERSGKVTLSKGLHPIRVDYFELSAGEVLEVRYAGPGVSKKLIPASKLVTANNARTSANDKKGISTLSENSSELLEEEFSPVLTDIMLYPNPVQSHFTINLGQSFESLSLKILDMNGRLVLERQISNTSSSVEVNLEQYYLPAGKYILSLSSSGKTIKNINLIKQ